MNFWSHKQTSIPNWTAAYSWGEVHAHVSKQVSVMHLQRKYSNAMPDNDTDVYIFVWVVSHPSVPPTLSSSTYDINLIPVSFDRFCYIFPLTTTMLCHLSSQWSSLWNPCFCSHHCCQWPHQLQSWVTAGDGGGTSTPISCSVESLPRWGLWWGQCHLGYHPAGCYSRGYRDHCWGCDHSSWWDMQSVLVLWTSIILCVYV